jgi:hypothetical protein
LVDLEKFLHIRFWLQLTFSFQPCLNLLKTDVAQL